MIFTRTSNLTIKLATEPHLRKFVILVLEILIRKTGDPDENFKRFPQFAIDGSYSKLSEKFSMAVAGRYIDLI
jgi:hypothetical protein